MQRFDLKRFRLDRKLTQKELAEILMCKQNYISNRKRNKTYFKREIGYIAV
jgi:transcriptional regulator with XRE-family HTH domain